MRRAQSKLFSPWHCCDRTRESGLLEQVDLAVLDVAVIQTAHAAQQIAEFDERDESPGWSWDAGRLWWSETTSRRSGASSHLSASNRPLSQ